MESVLSLQSSSILVILSEISSFSADILALLPPKLRTRILVHLPAFDLYRVDGERPGIWQGLPVTKEDVWRLRFETTLQKYSNVSPLEDVPDLSWQDRYLLSCLLNIPVYYQTTANQPTLGAAFFVTSDINLNDVGLVKVIAGSNCNGLVSLRSRGKSELTSHFISQSHKGKLESEWPFNLPVGFDLSTAERVKMMVNLFPEWQPSLLPVEYDEQECSPFNSSIYQPFVKKVKAIYVLSKYLRKYPYGEVENIETHVSGAENYCDCLVDMLGKHQTALCDRLVLSQPSMRKEFVPGEEESIAIFTPLSFSSSQLLERFYPYFPNLSSLSVTMHDSMHDCWTSPVLQDIKLNSLQLKVFRPTFKTVVKPTVSFSGISEICLQGLCILDTDFCDLFLEFLNSPGEQCLKLANVFIKEGEKELKVHPQKMREECCYKKSLGLHRVKGSDAIESVLSAYPILWLGNLSFYVVDVSAPFPKSTEIICKSVHVQRVSLSPEDLAMLSPILCKAEQVYLSLGQAGLATADHSIARLIQCVQLCKNNLQHLDLKHSFAYSGLSRQHMTQFFSVVFSLPENVLGNLVFDPSRLIDSFATASVYQVPPRNVLPQPAAFHVQLVKQQEDEQKYRVKGWGLLCEVWKDVGRGIKLKCISSVPTTVLDEMEDVLYELCLDVNM